MTHLSALSNEANKCIEAVSRHLSEPGPKALARLTVLGWGVARPLGLGDASNIFLVSANVPIQKYLEEGV